MVSEWNTLSISKIWIRSKIPKHSFPLGKSGLPCNPAMEFFCRETILPYVFFNVSFTDNWLGVNYFFPSHTFHATFTYVPIFYIKIHLNRGPTFSKFLIWISYSDTYKSVLAHTNNQIHYYPSSSVYICLSNSLHQNHAFILWACICIYNFEYHIPNMLNIHKTHTYKSKTK